MLNSLTAPNIAWTAISTTEREKQKVQQQGAIEGRLHFPCDGFLQEFELEGALVPNQQLVSPVLLVSPSPLPAFLFLSKQC